MSRGMRWTLITAGGIAATLVVAAAILPAAADWLVTRDGASIETRGPWRVEDRLVVFHRPDGSLASIRLSDVDLEASDRLTADVLSRADASARAKAVADEEARRPRQPLARLTERELPPIARPAAPSAPAAGEAGATEEAAGAPGAADTPETEDGLVITTWREESEMGAAGIDLLGVVRNASESSAVGVGVTATLFDETGEAMATAQAELSSGALPPGQSATFRASFPGVFVYARAELTASGQLIRRGPARPSADEPPPGR